LSPESFLTSARVAGQPGAGVPIDLILGPVCDNRGKSCYAIQLATLYARGVLTLDESILRLVLLSEYELPEILTRDLPADLVLALRDYCTRLPSGPEDAPWIGGVCAGVGNNDLETVRRETSREWYDGVCRWHKYFKK
jgi:hypothetical protein